MLPSELRIGSLGHQIVKNQRDQQQNNRREDTREKHEPVSHGMNLLTADDGDQSSGTTERMKGSVGMHRGDGQAHATCASSPTNRRAMQILLRCGSQPLIPMEPLKEISPHYHAHQMMVRIHDRQGVGVHQGHLFSRFGE